MSYASNVAIAFAIHADTNSLTYERGVKLAEEISDELARAADDRKGIPGIVIEDERDA